MKPNIKANTFSNLFLSYSGRRVPNSFGFTVVCSLVVEFSVGVWRLKLWHADVSGLTWCVDLAFSVTENIAGVLLYLGNYTDKALWSTKLILHRHSGVGDNLQWHNAYWLWLWQADYPNGYYKSQI